MIKRDTAVYLRVSTVDQSVASQAEVVNSWLKGHGITDTNWYVDKMSGATLERPRFKSMQQSIFDGHHKLIVFYSVDRFARTMIDGLTELDRWKKMGIRVVFVADQIDMDGSAMGELVWKIIISVRLAFAEAERERLLLRQKHGIEAARKRVVRAHKLKYAASGMSNARVAKKMGITISQAEKLLSVAPGQTYWGGKMNRVGKRKGDVKQVYKLWQKGSMSVIDIAAHCKVSARTAARYIQQAIADKAAGAANLRTTQEDSVREEVRSAG